MRNGFVSLDALAGRPVPGVVTASVSYLVSQAETAIYCGLGMTSGAADIVERYAPASARHDLLGRLRSLDPDEAWEGGMFLTERQGGSDVGANTTRAVQDGDEWLLSGEKHFCSNVDAEVFIVLARPDGAPAGSRGLATYIVPRLLPDGSTNGFRIKRLKPKLGTVGVPTGEVTLDGARAWLAGGAGAADADAAEDRHADAARDGRGINRMMEMVNGSRFGVALMGLGIHRRSFLEAAIYAARRAQFGNRIDSYPLVRETLVDMLVDLEAGMAATYECAAAARGAQDPESGRLVRRILVPLAKMRCTRMALWAASTGLEVLGGNGYMEDWPMARQLRDAQCHTIWEGAENILCIDVRRAMRGEHAHVALLARAEQALEAGSGHKALGGALDTVAASLRDTETAIAYLERRARRPGPAAQPAFRGAARRHRRGRPARRRSGLGAAAQRGRPQGGRGPALREPAPGHPGPARHHRPRPVGARPVRAARPLRADRRVRPRRLSRSQPGTFALAPTEPGGALSGPGDVAPAAERGAVEGVGRLIHPAVDLGHPVEAPPQDALDAPLERGGGDGARAARPLELHLDDPGLDVERRQLEVAPVGLHGRAHQFDQRAELGLTGGPDLVGQLHRDGVGCIGGMFSQATDVHGRLGPIGHLSIVPCPGPYRAARPPDRI